MKFTVFVLVLLTGAAHAGEFRVRAWKKPPSWKCRRLDKGALTCKSPYAGEEATMTMQLKPAPAGATLANLNTRAGRKTHFAKARDIHGREWLDALYQEGTGPLTRSSQTLVVADGKKQIFEVKFVASEEIYEDIQSTVNRTISSVKLYR